MVAVIVVAALAILALVTQTGALLVQRAHPARGQMVEVKGASLHIVDIGPRDASRPASESPSMNPMTKNTCPLISSAR